MTAAEFGELMALLDNIWGGLDEGREAGYRYILEDYPYPLVEAVVRELATEDRGSDTKWLPKPPEIAVRVRRVLATQAMQRRIEDRRAELARQAIGEVQSVEQLHAAFGRSADA